MDFKDLVEEFQRRQENTQIQSSPTQITIKSEISFTQPINDKTGSEVVESEKEQWTVRRDPISCNLSVTEDMPAERDTEEVKDQPQEHIQSGVEAPSDQGADLAERSDKVSQPTHSQPTKNLDKKACYVGMVCKKSTDQDVHPTTKRQDLHGQYSLPGDVPPNGRQADHAPVIIANISKPYLPRNKTISSEFQYPADQALASAPGSAMYLAKQTVGSWKSATDLPPHEEAQYKVMSGTTENLQRTSELPSSNPYKNHNSVDKPVNETYYDPAYMSGRETSTIRIHTTSLTMPAMISTETSLAHYMPPPSHLLPEYIQTLTVQGRHPTQDPGQHGCSASMDGSSAASSKNRLDLNLKPMSNWMGNSGEMDQEILWTFHEHTDFNYFHVTVNSWHKKEISPSQSPEDRECLSCMRDSPSSTSPENELPDEDKLVTSSPYASDGPSNHKTKHSWNEQDGITTSPIPCGRTKSNTENRMQSFRLQEDPMCFSQSAQEGYEQMSDSPSITYLAVTKSIPSFAANRKVQHNIFVEDPEEKEMIDAPSITHLAMAKSIPSFAHRKTKNYILTDVPEEEKTLNDVEYITHLAEAKIPSVTAQRNERDGNPVDIPKKEQWKMCDALSRTHLAQAKSIVTFAEPRKVTGKETAASKSSSVMGGLNQRRYSWVKTAQDEERQTIQD
ncbi:uncharacterized protein ACNLHF_023048 isoform 2-T2 [Anomaloglossus baeobatrachus]